MNSMENGCLFLINYGDCWYKGQLLISMSIDILLIELDKSKALKKKNYSMVKRCIEYKTLNKCKSFIIF